MLTAIGMQRAASKYPQTFPVHRAFLLLLLCVVAAHAQSGRSGVRKPAPSPRTVETAPTPPPPQPNPSTPPVRPAFTLIVGRYVQSPTVTVETSIAFNSFIERLKRSASIEVVPIGKEMTRKEAIERSKSEESENTYVVWLRMEVDTSDTELTTAGIPLNPGCLLVSYTVYSPQTAKVKAQGRVYQRGYASNTCMAKRGSPIPPNEPPHLPNEYRIKITGSEAADRVLQALDLPSPGSLVFGI